MTQIEHPHLYMPWYMLHPCQTSQHLKLMLGQESKVEQGAERESVAALSKYMTAWFTLVGPVFELQMQPSTG